MKDSWKVYIRGNEDRPREVIKTLEDLGGINYNNLNGDYEDVYYYISPLGKIEFAVSFESILLSFIKEFYKEIQLPRWKPKYKEHFYYFTSTGLISQGIWDNSPINDLYYEFGNYFKTFEEAELARDKIKEILN